jgi:hypothetical protein
MISTWIKIFDPDNKTANDIAGKWAQVVNNSFVDNCYNQNIFNEMYNKILKPEKGKHIWGFMNFYGVSILANNLAENIEPVFFKYVLNFPAGIYYFGYNQQPRPGGRGCCSRKVVTLRGLMPRHEWRGIKPHRYE